MESATSLKFRQVGLDLLPGSPMFQHCRDADGYDNNQIAHRAHLYRFPLHSPSAAQCTTITLLECSPHQLRELFWRQQTFVNQSNSAHQSLFRGSASPPVAINEPATPPTTFHTPIK